MALKPPSRFRMQLLAYSFLARKAAASATSSAVPKRLRGMASRAWDLDSEVMARSIY